VSKNRYEEYLPTVSFKKKSFIFGNLLNVPNSLTITGNIAKLHLTEFTNASINI